MIICWNNATTRREYMYWRIDNFTNGNKKSVVKYI